MKMLRIRQVLERFPVGRTSWWNGIKAGKYPKPHRIGANTVAWLESDIDALIQGIIQAEIDRTAKMEGQATA